MSVVLLATSLFNRLRTRARTLLPVEQPPTPPRETPRQQRDRLRNQVLALGGAVTEIETIEGNCPAQTAQQIRDLTRWIEGRSAPVN
jgi:hypothetical protein